MKKSLSLGVNRLVFWLAVAAMIAAISAYSLFASTQATNGSGLRQLLPLAMPVVLLAVLFAVKQFQLAVLLLPISALAVPFDLPTGTESKLPASLLLAFLLMAIWVASMALRGWRLAPTPLNRPMLVFGIVCIASLGWGLIWRDPGLIDWSGRFIYVQIGALMAILLSLCATLLIGNFVASPAGLKYLMAAFLVVCSIMLVLLLLEIDQRILTIKGLWSLWLVAPLYALLIAQPRLPWWCRVLLMLWLVLTFYQVLVNDSQWVSGWLPAVVAVLAVTFLRSRKWFVVLMIMVALVYALPPVRAFFATTAQANVDDGALERLEIAEQNWRVVREHWVLGTGPAGYAIYYMTYYREDARSTHNNYLDILAQFGFVGMAVWLWLVATAVWEGWQLSQRAPPGFVRTMAIAATGGWIGAMASMLLGDWVLPFAYNQTITGYKYTVYSWLFLGTLITIRQLVPPQPVLRSSSGH